MTAPRLILQFAVAGFLGVAGADRSLAQDADLSACLDQPLEVSWTPPEAGDRAKAAGKGVLSSVLGAATGGAVQGKGDDAPELSRRPRLPKTRVEPAGSDFELEIQGGAVDGELLMAVRVRKDRAEGGPHLVALQDIHCRVLFPERVEVFELWQRGSLSVSWSSSTYSDGRLTDSDSGGFDSNWGDFRQRYPTNADVPGIWQSYGEPPLDGIRGVTAVFALPDDAAFEPSEWYLVTHVTRPAETENTVTTAPLVASISPGEKDRFAFTEARKVAWQPQTASRRLALGVNTSLFATDQGTLVCKDDCRKILEEIDRLECAREDCDDAKRAVDQALADLADARDELAAAESEIADAKVALESAGRAMDEARAALEAAQRKLDIEAAKQKRLQESLARGGHGLSAERVVRDRVQPRIRRQPGRTGGECRGGGRRRAIRARVGRSHAHRGERGSGGRTAGRGAARGSAGRCTADAE